MTHHTVSRIGHKGDGLIETPAGVLHLPKVLAGETVEIVDNKLLRVISASPERIAPFCPHYDTCGGCKFQHWREDAYRAWKHNTVVQALGFQKLETSVQGLVDAHGTGRRRVSLHVRNIDGAWRAGFMVQGSHDLAALENCSVLVPALVKSPQIAARFGPVLGECDVAITLADNGLDVHVRAERKAVERRTPHLVTLFHENKLTRLSVNTETIAIVEKPVVAMGGTAVELPVGSFLQATKAGEQALVELVLESLAKTKTVADLFSGMGTFTFPLAHKFRVTAFDSDKAAIVSLLSAARKMQGLKPIAAEVRNLFNAPLTANELNGFDALVLDPPRAGALAQVRNIATSKVRRVVYISCDVQSFARDARTLVDAGFNLKNVTPVDQFKWSAHVELVGVFAR